MCPAISVLHLDQLFINFHDWGRVGQSESDIFVSELKANEHTIMGSSVLLFLFQWDSKNVDLITMG